MLKITLDEISIPDKGIIGLEGCETEIRVVTFPQYPKVFPELQEQFPPQHGSVAVLVIRQKVLDEWVQTAHFMGGRSSSLQHDDILLDGLVIG